VLGQLAEQGMTAANLALLLEAIAADRVRRGADQTQVDLVWTGPEGQAATRRDTRVVVRELFMSAQSSVLVAGYAVHQGVQVFRALAERLDELPSLSARLYLNIQRHRTDTSLDAEIVRRFARSFRIEQWPGTRQPDLFYDPRALGTATGGQACLHAKCIVIDRRLALVSSANFTEAAQLRNIEVGALIRSPVFASSLAQQFESLVDQGLLLPVPTAAG
jgi:phosphatidylserine/phosphatidylglycerophosphate/cardiolipin synthase-like enzyme